jgi:spore coat protein U-like protein
MLVNRLPILILTCAALGAAAPARAALVFTCTVTASGIVFGTYNPLIAGGDASTGSWAVNCTATGSGSATVSGTLTLSTGNSGSYAQRYLLSGTNKLDYNIYLTPTYTQIVGNGTGGTYAPTASGTVTAGQAYQATGTFYGFIPGAQYVPPGGYIDSIVVTVTY